MAFPTTAPPALSNWQMSYNSLLLGASTVYDVGHIEGLDLPNIRTGDIVRPRENGEFIGLDVLGGRDLIVTGDYVNDGTSIQHAQQALATAFPVAASTEAPFWIQLPNLPPLGIMARTRKRNTPTDLGYSVSAIAQMAMQLHASDPRLYAQAQVLSCGVGQSLAGFVFNATPPFVFTNGSVAGTIAATNAGNFETRPVLTITGPVTSPTVQNTTAGWTLAFNQPVLTGDTLVIDTDTHSILYYTGGVGAGASRRSWLVPGSTWPSYQNGVAGMVPGVNNFQFTSTDGSPVAGTLAVQWASAYML